MTHVHSTASAIFSHDVAHYIDYCNKHPDSYPKKIFDVIYPVLVKLSFHPDIFSLNSKQIVFRYFSIFADKNIILTIRFSEYQTKENIHCIYRYNGYIYNEEYFSTTDPKWILKLNKIIINFKYNYIEKQIIGD